MSTAVVNFTVANTSAWALTFNLTRDGAAWDISNYRARMQLRSPAESSVAEATLTSDQPNATLKIEGSTLSIDVPRGIALGIRAGSYAYDVLLLRDDEAIRAIEGTVTVKQGVTR